MKIKSVLSCVLLAAIGSSACYAQSQFAGTYYGELDEQISTFGVVVQPREKSSDVTATVDEGGNLVITGISEVRGTVDGNGNIFITNDAGFGFQTGTIIDRTISMNGEHSQNLGTRINEYWIVATMNTSVSSAFPDATPLPDNWNSTPWFGNFSGAYFPWIYHETLHFMFVSGSDNAALWLYYPPLGWLYTLDTVYPWLYSVELNTWLYYSTTQADLQWFYNDSTETWFAEDNN